MKTLKFTGDGKKLITGIGHEFKNGDTIDLPDDIADELLKTDSRHFDLVMTKEPDVLDIIEIRKPKRLKGG